MHRSAGSETAQSSEQSASDFARDEISLIDLWLVLMRRKIIFLSVLLTAVAAAVILIFVTKPIYESRAVFEIGKVGSPLTGGGSIAVEDASALTRWLREEYGIDNPDRRDVLPRLDSIEHSPKSGQNILILKVRDLSIDGAREFLSSVGRRLMDRHQKLYDEARSALELRLRDLEAEITVLQNQVTLLGNMTRELNDRGQAAVVAVERGGLLATLAKLRDQRAGLALSLSGIQSYPTRHVGEPNALQNPVRPRPVLYLSLGITIGLLLGTFAAFFAELLSKARREMIVRQGMVPPNR